MLSEKHALEVKVTHQEFTAITLDQILFLIILLSISPVFYISRETALFVLGFFRSLVGNETKRLRDVSVTRVRGLAGCGGSCCCRLISRQQDMCASLAVPLIHLTPHGPASSYAGRCQEWVWHRESGHVHYSQRVFSTSEH